jgi:sigma-E factor negative regulatory protein RseC
VIEQTAIVISLRDGLADVQALRQGACGGCNASGACGVSLIDRFLGRRPIHLAVTNDIGARVGDRVILGVPEAALLRAAVAAYFVPLLSLLVGGVAGRELGAFSHLLAPEPASIVGGLMGFLLALRWLRGYSKSLAGDSRWRAVILRREEEAIGVPLT